MAISKDTIEKRGGNGAEKLPSFLATPERVSQYLELKSEEVTAQMKSVQGRQELFQKLMEHEETIRKDHADFSPRDMKMQLESAGEALNANERYTQKIRSPEKKELFGRAWESVKGFAKKHPIVTTLLAASVVAGGIAAGFYFAGNWELLMAATGLRKIVGATEAATELVPPTAATEALPGGGVFEIPSPVSPDDIGTPL